MDKPDNLPTQLYCVVSLASSAMVRKFKELLDKLSEDDFDTVSAQLISLANEPEFESSGQMLGHLMRVMSAHAVRPSLAPPYVGMYARLCQKMMEGLSPTVQDKDIVNASGMPLSSTDLFRKCLLNQVEEDFERFCMRAEKYVATSNPEGKEEMERKGIRVARFLGELFKVKMVLGGIVRARAKKLIYVGNLEDTIEPLCELLTTAGEMLEVAKSPRDWQRLDDCFTRMKKVRESDDVSLHLRKRLQVSHLHDLSLVENSHALR